MKSFQFPRPLLNKLYEHFAKIEEILTTLEDLMNKEGPERIQKSLKTTRKKSRDHKKP